MKNNVDFIYEYSDLNLFQTRVKVLTGRYRGVILEFGGSGLAQHGDKNLFNFDYTLYEIPEHLACYQLRGTKEFEKFLAYLLVDVIDARNNDKNEKEKLKEAASYFGKQNPEIKINGKFYLKKQPIAQGLQGF